MQRGRWGRHQTGGTLSGGQVRVEWWMGKEAYVVAKRGGERMLSGTQWSGEGSVCRSGTQ